ncbi:MAG: pyruvate dehydrogenase complex dihydrolipoamide acetyltransferase [Proteobacteria bacterium]|nr:pyruvate dehydrogenase complex dihydrolipoamide acetyltransferase [Pseudomonadota bacterium]MDA1355764.1 pyruvate dehydrogenase complex dihydrolipoamide acetyltransferase [Pseudomonadota bacterium]
MPINVLMPALSPTMTEGNVASWMKKEGDKISAGDLLCEIETDKATMEIEAIDDGVLGKIVTPDGTENVPVNAVIGIILEEGEDAAVLDGIEIPAVAAAPVETAAPAQAAPVAPVAPAAQVIVAQAAPASQAPPVAHAAQAARPEGRIFASPLARRMATQSGLDLAAIAGSGPKGRIVKADIEAVLSGAAPSAPAPTTMPAAPLAAIGPYEDIPTSKMRKVIAQRLQEAKQTVPHFYLTIECEIDGLLKVRKELNGRSDAYKLSVNDFVIRASALALRKVPECNASWIDGGLRQYSGVDISVAVAIDDGLVTPILRNADHKGLSALSEEMKELAARARAKPMGLMPEEYQGGTFSISNLGMLGIKEFAAIINPPQSMILAVGAGEQRPVVKDGALAIATMMSCTLSVDHRVVDGAAGARFLGAFKGFIEDPLTMLL